MNKDAHTTGTSTLGSRKSPVLLAGLSCFQETLQDLPFARRLSARVGPQCGTWVQKRCNGRNDVPCVLDVSVRGLFIETELPAPVS